MADRKRSHARETPCQHPQSSLERSRSPATPVNNRRRHRSRCLRRSSPASARISATIQLSTPGYPRPSHRRACRRGPPPPTYSAAREPAHYPPAPPPYPATVTANSHPRCRQARTDAPHEVAVPNGTTSPPRPTDRRAVPRDSATHRDARHRLSDLGPDRGRGRRPPWVFECGAGGWTTARWPAGGRWRCARSSAGSSCPSFRSTDRVVRRVSCDQAAASDPRLRRRTIVARPEQGVRAEIDSAQTSTARSRSPTSTISDFGSRSRPTSVSRPRSPDGWERGESGPRRCDCQFGAFKARVEEIDADRATLP